MKLVASVIVRNELGRYLEPCVGSLLQFCDEVRILDNGSEDDWLNAIMGTLGENGDRVLALFDPGVAQRGDSLFVGHALARQRLLEFTLQAEPTHILAIDADEFITDGMAVRAACEQDRYGAWGVCMQEVWNAREGRLELRQDGGWAEHDVTMLWAPARVRPPLRIVDRGPATGRTPETVRNAPRGHTCSGCLHFGWTNQDERAARHGRYVIADGGRFHAKGHLDSILWPDEQIALSEAQWPDELAGYRDAILAHAGASE